MFTLILYYISYLQLGGCISVGVYIGIVYIMATIRGICVSCRLRVVLGVCVPFGPWMGGVCKLVFTLVLYILYTLYPLYIPYIEYIVYIVYILYIVYIVYIVYRVIYLTGPPLKITSFSR